jgi:hypothetical protein
MVNNLQEGHVQLKRDPIVERIKALSRDDNEILTKIMAQENSSHKIIASNHVKHMALSRIAYYYFLKHSYYRSI